MTGPLAGVTVLDLTQYIVGPYATKLLADYGADVIKVEPPQGDAARRLGPFLKDEPHPERSGTFLYLNANKRSVVLDLQQDAGRQGFLQLLDSADIIVESFRPGVLDALGIAWELIHARRPDLPLVSISNFGQSGPYRDYKASDLVLYGYAGEMYTIGSVDREPVKQYGTAALIEAGAAAASAICAALQVGLAQGVGQHVDFAISEAHIGGADRRHATLTGYEFAGQKTVRAGEAAAGFANGVYVCADGYVHIISGGQRLERLADMLGNPAWLADAKWSAAGAAFDRELVDEFNRHFYPWLLQRTKRDVWAEARRAKVLCGPLFTVDEVFVDPHLRERGFWQESVHPEVGPVTLPGRPFIMSESPWELRRPAPLLGEHTEEVLREAGARVATRTSGKDRVQKSTGAPRLPLQGVRVLDFCVVWAGPYATMLLGDLGAEVIKPENPFVMQPSTRSGLAHPPAEILRAPGYRGAYPNRLLGPRPWNYSPGMVQLYRNKLSFSVDWRQPEGQAILARLIATVDVVVENNAPGTMEHLGFGYERLRQIRPDIIMLRAPAYGCSGPYADARALGVHMESVIGHTLLRGYPDCDPSSMSSIFAADYLSGSLAALAVMFALRHREQTGRGQVVELGQTEAAAALVFQALMDYSLNRTVQSRSGNRSIYGAAPYGVYPCRAAGSALEAGDRWIAISVTNDAEWQALRQVMGEPPWSCAAELATAAGRVVQQDVLDARLAEWTADWDDYALCHRLQAAGVPAAPVLEASRVYDDPQVQARGIFQPQKLFDLEQQYRLLTPFYRFPATPATVRQPPVAMGEHNEYVYREVLGVDGEEYERLQRAGHVNMDYAATVP
jgi:crotonobetainyl-CoA:carnitine CoA-transferase CaiB-like acyl-CoA transferase